MHNRRLPTTLQPYVTAVGALTPEWWTAIGGAAVAGAVLFPTHRLVGGVLLGVALLALGLADVMPDTPCCAACAGASASSPPPPASAPDVQALPLIDTTALLAQAARAGGCVA